MLRSLKDLEGYEVEATDGDIGRVANFLLDDEGWTIRFLVVATGNWLDDREVLISPLSFRKVEWASRGFHLALTKDMIKNSPDTFTQLPVSRQHERDYFRYYGYPNYWGSSGIWNTPGGSVAPIPEDPLPAPEAGADDFHLRSAKELRGYHIQGSDDEIGHVDDFIVDDETWAIRYLVVDTSNGWFGKRVLVSPYWALEVSWEARKIHLGLSRQVIKNCPQWEPEAPVNRAYEERLFDYYGRPVYWDRGQPEDRDALASTRDHR